MPQVTTVECLIAAVKGRLEEVGPVFLGETFDIDTWALLCELVLPERFRAPPCDPEPIPAASAGDPQGRVLVMERRARRGFALHSPHDPPKPDGEDGTRGLAPAGSALTPKQAGVRPPGNRRTPGRGVG